MQAKKSEIRNEILKRRKHAVEYFSLLKEELYQNSGTITWKDKNKEVVINGTYYELVGIRFLNDRCILSLEKDDFETSLFDAFLNLHNKLSKEKCRLLFGSSEVYFLTQSANTINFTQIDPVPGSSDSRPKLQPGYYKIGEHPPDLLECC